MSPRSVIVVLSSTLAVGLLCCAFVQRSRLVELRHEQQRQRSRQLDSKPPEVENAPPALSPTDAPRPVSSELLKLRNQVSQLTRQRDEWAGVSRENERLKAQLASRATNGPASSDFIRKTEVKFSGYDTPENTLRTFLWAIQNRNLEAWLNTMTPEMSEPFRKAKQQPGFSEQQLFQGTEAIPGFAILNRESLSRPAADGVATAAGENEEIVVQVQLSPDLPPQDIVLRRIEGQWKMARWN